MDAVSEAKSNLHIQMDGQLSALSSPSSAESRSHRAEEQQARRILTSQSNSDHCGGMAWSGSQVASLANETECRDDIKAGQGKLKRDGSCQGESVEGAGLRGCMDEGGSSVFTGREVMPLVILSEAAWNPSGSGKEQPFEEVLMKSQTVKPETDTSLGHLPHKDTVVPVRLPEMEPKLTQMTSKSKTTQSKRAEAAGGRPVQADPASSDGPTEPFQNAHHAQIYTENPKREVAESSSAEHQREGWRSKKEQGEERTGATGGRGNWPLQMEGDSTSTEVKPSPEDHTETPKDSKSPSHESHRRGTTPESQQSPSPPAEAFQNPQPSSAEKQGAWENHNLQFKEAATMTTSTEWGPPPKSKCQDAEVQTIADVCSRSTATSPLLFPASMCQHSCRLEEEDAEILAVLSPLNCGTFQAACSEDLSSRSGRVSATDPQMFSQCQVHVEPTLPDHQRMQPMLQKVRLEAGACQSVQASTFYTATSGPNCGLKATADTGRLPLRSGFAPLQPVYQINIQANRIPEIGICGKDSPPTTSPPRQTRSEHSNGNHVANSHGGPAPECLPPQEPPVPRDPLPPMKGSGSKKTRLQFVLENDQTVVSKNSKNSEHEADPHDSWAFGLDHDQETALSKPGALSHPPRNVGEEQELGEQGSSARKRSECEPVQDVVWDEQGMTWEVYGASLDPESLGFAIQSHLQSKIREQERKVRAIRKSICSESSQGKRGGRKSRNVFRVLLKSVRRPACCGRPRSSAVLD
ncbi:G protein-regulated inducer of neurite outgrowth 3-like [Brienomyrus brachyistius]|uniref:G protein-regulated inducer of neurite outgrowth 3-like n=1 Tax=Brienomyrus brachyistius TaxID=42636 RepID=UPI0020B383C1|nr:G protein-regulated inducer of neurite outgrowth 3-like [Brienomyrus brachyistius]XP_048827737.1 G protein-regulated inducer of neurite outgrowth 3-like [Brienomyrus brachyistius]